MITYKINYHKGCYEVIEYEIGEMDTPSISSKIRLKTNSIESLELLVTSIPSINFRLSHKVPEDIKEILFKYRNVL
jgi:hypothetical protein